GIADDYGKTFIAQKDMKIDVWLASHAAQFKMHDKYKPGDPYHPDRFVDPQGFQAAVLRLEKAYIDQLARETQKECRPTRVILIVWSLQVIGRSQERVRQRRSFLR